MSAPNWPEMTAKRILLVAKRPMAARLSDEDLCRLEHHPLLSADVLRHAADDHERARQTVRAALAGHHLRERMVDDLQSEDAKDVDLMVTVGGDGTVFAVNALGADCPLLTVNSDPARSVGHFTRCRAENFSALFAAWMAGTHVTESIPRLALHIAGVDSGRAVLNDCLFTSRNPAAITRYVLDVAGEHELQHSSGVWVSTAAGSTGGIRSAGMDPPLSAQTAALLFCVREPFHGRRMATLLSGRQTPPLGLTLTPAMPDVDLYIDGPHARIALPIGASVAFSSAPRPLVLVTKP